MAAEGRVKKAGALTEMLTQHKGSSDMTTGDSTAAYSEVVALSIPSHHAAEDADDAARGEDGEDAQGKTVSIKPASKQVALDAPRRKGSHDTGEGIIGEVAGARPG